MDAVKAGGRYVIMPTAAPINTPLSPQTEQNYYTFIETALELGKY
jgi:thiazole synthase ThiGH ThiG subunit